LAGSLVEAHKKNLNGKVFGFFHNRMRRALAKRETVVADATNLSGRARRQLREIAQEADCPVHLVFFQNSQIAKRRNLARGPDELVPELDWVRLKSQYNQARISINGREHCKYSS